MTTRPTRITLPGMLLLTAAATLLLVGGCERKVTGDLNVVNTDSEECFACHNGQLDAQQGEWANSVHASGENVDYTSRPGAGCTRCHNGDGFIDKVEGNYSAGTDYGNAKAIGCFACHNPHETADFTLRTNAAVTMASGEVFNLSQANLCVNCHQALLTGNLVMDSVLLTSPYWGSHHGPQGDFLIGSGGYEGFPGYTDDASIAHRDLAGACVYCHMATANTHAGYNVGGHSFNMEDEAGNNLSLLCRNCHSDIGAYGGPYTAIMAETDIDNDGTIEGFQIEVDGLLDSLATLLIAQGELGLDDHPVGPFPRAIADGHLAGALFNYIIVEEDRSHGVHNPKYIVNLLQESIAYVDGLP